MLIQRRWLAVAAAVLAIGLTARLGIWQLDRADQKLRRQTLLNERSALPALDVAQLAQDARRADEQLHQHIRLKGRWSGAQTVFLDNRQMAGRPGFLVLTPLVLDDGKVVLVQRGWTPRNFLDRTALPEVPTPGGQVELLGRVAPPPARLFEFGTSGSGRIRQNVDLQAYGRETGLKLAPLSVVQIEPASYAALPQGAASAAEGGGAAMLGDGLLRDWPAPTAEVGKHHGYAFQWFALSALLAGLLLWFQVLQPFFRFPRT